MKKICDYYLENVPEQTVDLPKNAKILVIKKYNGNRVLYALADPKNDKEQRTILCRRTDQDINTENCTIQYISSDPFYVSRTPSHGENEMFHFFEKTPI